MHIEEFIETNSNVSYVSIKVNESRYIALFVVKKLFPLDYSIFLLSRYFFSIDFPQLKAWSYPTLLVLSFINFKSDTRKSDTQIYKRTPMSKCDFSKVALQLSRVNLLHIFRTPFPRNTSGWLLLDTLYYSRDPDGQKFYSRQRIL